MLRRLNLRQRQAIKRWAVLLLSVMILACVFAAVPYIASALPAFSPRSGEEPATTGEARAAFALAGGGGYGDASGEETTDVSVDSNAVPDESDDTEDPIPAPTPGESDLPVISMNLCWYDLPEEAELYIINRTKYNISLDKYASADFPLTGIITDAPLVLIMHTHGSESYLDNGYDFYDPKETFRSTEDDGTTVVHIGDVLCERLNDLGIPTVHDRTMYDTTDFNKSYTYSRQGILKMLEEYPSIRFVIDLHRDSIFSSKGTNVKPVTEIDGKKTAQLMIVVGTDEGGAAHPNWAGNLTVAAHLQSRMNELFPTLARPINLRSASFNQALTGGSILVECGSCGNTIEEAENAIILFAEAYASLLKDKYDK